ncbi:TetR/AcrR family transcriptional regulator [Roseomonas gilardii]|uniref:TetR/AcrR family transcriptional regulator n=1 Tax=Roseomonas gilardii TaxID=257708 RepID=UPI00047FFDC8|nr:TetR/AcrR family transcriptional regulator [Roseomonas gilardii]SUE44237.1 Potential acrAB operon repressor [Roseomonas gilardii subsp. rosea]
MEFALEKPPRPRGRSAGSQRTRQNILDAARAIFAQKGYSGANVGEIVALAQTTKPMVYYHFGSKEELFSAVLEEVYAEMRSIEQAVAPSALPPLEAIRRLVEVTFDYHNENPDWSRLISVANIYAAQHVSSSPTISSRSSVVLGLLEEVLARGVRAGVFRADVDPLHLHLLIVSTCFYRISNRHTWKAIFGRALDDPADAAAQRRMVTEAVLAYLRPEAARG